VVGLDGGVAVDRDEAQEPRSVTDHLGAQRRGDAVAADQIVGLHPPAVDEQRGNAAVGCLVADAAPPVVDLGRAGRLEQRGLELAPLHPDDEALLVILRRTQLEQCASALVGEDEVGDPDRVALEYLLDNAELPERAKSCLAPDAQCVALRPAER
jgi:hypothetical protein